jgi:hypothetical protein
MNQEHAERFVDLVAKYHWFLGPKLLHKLCSTPFHTLPSRISAMYAAYGDGKDAYAVWMTAVKNPSKFLLGVLDLLQYVMPPLLRSEFWMESMERLTKELIDKLEEEDYMVRFTSTI